VLGLLSLIPHLIKRCPVCWWGSVGVAGWNTYRCLFERLRGCCLGGLGTLLGPEETPVRVCSWCDHFWPVRSNADGVFVVAVVVGRGVVVC
jgi:hypothetical protein